MARSPSCEKAPLNKGAWTKEEDERLVAYMRARGEVCWQSVPKAAGLLRCGNSCRLRWIYYLRPDIKLGNFTDEEDEIIIRLHSILGNKFVIIDLVSFLLAVSYFADRYLVVVQVVSNREAASRADGQRDQELLEEQPHEAQAPRTRHRSTDAPPGRRRPR
jgi:hypothetical protein